MGTIPISGALTTLAASTASVVTGTMDTEMDAPFLCKQLQWNAAVMDLDPSDAVLIGLAHGDATQAEIETALQQSLTDPNDVGEWPLVLKKQIIWWESLFVLTGQQNVCNERIKLGGGKGIPIAEGKGVNLFVYNISTTTALTTGSVFACLATLKGVWLGD